MSRKVDPRSLRIGITKNWRSNWYAEDENYAKFLLEDHKIRTYLGKRLRNAGLSSVKIDRSIKNVKVTIFVSRPGIVIGRKGSGLSLIRDKLKHITQADIDLQIEEVKKPDADANAISSSIATQIERRVSARRAINMAVDRAIDAGVTGIKVQAKGTLYGPNSIATRVQAAKGPMPTQTIRANISFAKSVAYTRGGTIGIKVWVYNSEAKN